MCVCVCVCVCVCMCVTHKREREGGGVVCEIIRITFYIHLFIKCQFIISGQMIGPKSPLIYQENFIVDFLKLKTLLQSYCIYF